MTKFVAASLRKVPGALTAALHQSDFAVLQALQVDAANDPLARSRLEPAAATPEEGAGEGSQTEDAPLYFMPHCPHILYDAVLHPHWRASGIPRIVVIGNRSVLAPSACGARSQAARRPTPSFVASFADVADALRQQCKARATAAPGDPPASAVGLLLAAGVVEAVPLTPPSDDDRVFRAFNDTRFAERPSLVRAAALL